MFETFRAVLIQMLLLMVGLSSAFGHEIRPAVVTTDLSIPGRYSITLSANIEAMLAGIGSEHKDTDDAPGAAHYNQLRALPSDQLRARFEAFAPRWLQEIGITFDGQRPATSLDSVKVPEGVDLSLARISLIQLSGVPPANAKAFQWTYPRQFGASVLRVKRHGSDELETSWLKDGVASAEIALVAGPPQTKSAIFADYLKLGFTHILPQGLDHILFVLGLFLLSTQVRPLLVQVTAFTIAHSITLGLGLYGVVSVAPSIVEPLIALSIVFVAVENMLTPNLSAWRPFIVFSFGLLHGLGFADVLRELGLPRDQYLLGLVGFNVGVECGQLTTIALASAATSFWFGQRSWYRARIVLPASAAIALIGLFWTVERIWFA